MNDETRRANLRRFLDEKLQGDRQRLIARSGLSKGRISQLLKTGEKFGELASRDLAAALGLSPDYFERDEKTARLTLTPDEADLLRLWEPLFAEQKQDLLDRLRVEHERALRTIEEVKARHLDIAVPDGIVERALGLPPAQKPLPIAGVANPPAKRKR